MKNTQNILCIGAGRMIKVVSLFVAMFTINHSFGQTLEESALLKIDELESLIIEVENKGLNAQRERLAVRTSETFLAFAKWDEANVEKNTELYDLIYDTQTAEEMANDLADFERRDVIILLDESIETLKKVKVGEIVRKSTPIVDWSKVTIEGDQLSFQNRPVFISDYTWKPDVGELNEYFGNLDGFYLAPQHVSNKNGDISNRIVQNLESKPDGTLGSVFLAHTNPPSWTTEKYGKDFNQFHGEPFHFYDIDNPGAREMMSYLLAGTVPKMAGKNYTKLGYMLANEPRWLTHKDGDKKVWYSVDVSDYTKEKFKLWLESKHKTVEHLNSTWGSQFASFSEVTISTPIELALHGTPKWYDWVTFNEDRVTDWFLFLKGEIKKHDPEAKTHNKIIPSFFTDNLANTGIDWEAITEMSEINGNDAAADHKMLWGKPQELSEVYSYNWRELFLGYDFMKSIQPNQINFNSESHFLSTTRSRDLYMTPEYVRAVHWAAHMLGLNATRMWYWPRKEDGSIDAKSDDKGYPGSNNQQPRVTNELHATIMDLNAFSEEVMAMQRQRKPIRLFYSKTSAKNNREYMDYIFELYESLNFEGVPLGFATKNILQKQDHKQWDVLLIHETETVTAEELVAIQTYLDNGGTVILDQSSLKKNEYGLASETEVQVSKGALYMVNSVSEMREKALEIVKGSLPELSISESNAHNTKTCFWRCIKNQSGNNILSIINLGNKESKVQISLKNASYDTACRDLLTGNMVSAKPTLQPNEVLFLEITDELPTSSNSPLKNNKSSDQFGVLYPNPSKGTFKIELDQQYKEVTVEIFDIKGIQVDHFEAKNVKEIVHAFHLNMEGIYMVKLSVGTKEQSILLNKRN